MLPQANASSNVVSAYLQNKWLNCSLFFIFFTFGNPNWKTWVNPALALYKDCNWDDVHKKKYYQNTSFCFLRTGYEEEVHCEFFWADNILSLLESVLVSHENQD